MLLASVIIVYNAWTISTSMRYSSAIDFISRNNM